jgi:hypothetical protein
MQTAGAVFGKAEAIGMPLAHHVLAAVNTPRRVLTKHAAIHETMARILHEHRSSPKPQPAQRYALAAREIEAPQPHLRFHGFRAWSRAIGRPEIELPILPMPFTRRIQRPQVTRDVAVARTLKLLVAQIKISLRYPQPPLTGAGDQPVVGAVTVVPAHPTKDAADPLIRGPLFTRKLHHRRAIRLALTDHDLGPRVRGEPISAMIGMPRQVHVLAAKEHRPHLRRDLRDKHRTLRRNLLPRADRIAARHFRLLALRPHERLPRLRHHRFAIGAAMHNTRRVFPHALRGDTHRPPRMFG